MRSHLTNSKSKQNMADHQQESVINIFQEIRREIANVHNNAMQSQSKDIIDNAIVRIEQCMRRLRTLQQSLPRSFDEDFQSYFLQCQNYIQILKEIETDTENQSGYQVPTEPNSGRGRPKLQIECRQIQLLLDANFSAVEIAKTLGISRRTVHSRLRSFRMSVRATYSDISDNELDTLVNEVTAYNKNLGYRSVRSRLDSKGVKVTYARVRASMLRTDATGMAVRFSNSIKRRVYKVAGPNSLWHIDGNHKLIRWKFVVHGGVDGYSRLITFMAVATNNRSQTVLDRFLEATEQYCWPSRVRCDKGVENVKVAEKMLEHNGANRGSIIIGKSVHNQRIERTWVDVYKGSLCVYYDLFTSLEVSGILDINDPIHMFALHFTFKPLIQQSLNDFTGAFNRHPLSTEKGKSPIQLWTKGVIQAGRTTTAGNAIFDLNDSTNRNHVQNDNLETPSPVLDQLTSMVELDDIACPVAPSVYIELASTIQPLRDATHPLGLDIFERALRFLLDNQSDA